MFMDSGLRRNDEMDAVAPATPGPQVGSTTPMPIILSAVIDGMKK